MKLIKFTSVLLCFLMLTAMFAGCDTPEESKADISESNISEVSEEVSRQESEVTEKIEPWGTDYDWDFLKGWQRHSNNIKSGYFNSWEPYPNYSSAFESSMNIHKGIEVLVHIAMSPYYVNPDNPIDKAEKAKFPCDIGEMQKWLEAGGIPLEYQTIRYFDVHGNEQAARAFFGYLSFADVEKLIEYAEKNGYYLYFSFVPSNSTAADDNTFNCPKC